MDTKKNLLDLTLDDLREFIRSLGEPAYRADQVFQWLWQKGCRDFAEMTNISKAFREKLAEASFIGWPDIEKTAVSSDGTVKFLLRYADGELVETVLIPEEGHTTQCLSSQVGCPMACTFCSTGQMGLTRNMTMGEILGQVLVAREYIAAHEDDVAPLRNIVFMGMGDPLLNVTEMVRALTTMTHDKGLGFSSRRITVSSVGILKGLEVLGDCGLAQLAISLHAPTQELREQLMPKAARQLPLDQLMAVLDRYPLKPRERVTYEYILLRGVNDRPEHARQLVKLLGGRKAKVNLIAYNPSPGAPYKAPHPDDILAFEKILWAKGLTAILRKSKGQDIAAACGQLKAKHISES
ncbi:23S rRNA (adenine2503-C2)-methyltransferase [Desulfobaculum xiamenense]|uniref:Probable dual-specificity RNA methyltransferase RlmN n=1 Tax=Desulfobaculum xiamenense TaxID=995050 RepID=A0A846QTY1_9BACT|nr:23S rRNA (adenine(2503)-C(2))-methyltransferase RlmN [Desulfobaculum xiamenense]NJB68099.1 23S rRNA (adenine2503-C2)-methyltransferase [Desulfobaculum xiamenense]